ncbi:MAG: RagB/SusD family nutrient uptake outer membrane protein [Paludibacteraceae bacterium]
MKTKLTIILLVAGFIGFTSCNMLDVELNGTLQEETYYNTEAQLQVALNGVYATLAESSLYANNMLGRLGLDADEGYNCYSSDVGSVSQYQAAPSDTKILNYWRDLYEGINKANLLLANIDKPTMDSAKRVDIEGQAKFLRAYYYSMLVTRFGDVPLVLTLAKSGSASEVQIAQATAKDIYNFIISEMAQAADMVSDINKVESAGRVSKSAVWGLLSRVCLYAAGNPINDTKRYTEAAYWAKKVIDSQKHALNSSYKQIFINYAQDLYDSKESIWEVEFYGNNTGTYTTVAGMVGRNNGILNTGGDNTIGYCAGMIRSTTVLYDTYNASGLDTRRDWCVAPYYFDGNPAVVKAWTAGGTKFQRHCGKFRREYELLTPKSTTATPQNFPLLRYADVLLMYAESVNMKETKTTSETDSAYWAVNQVRRRAYGYNLNTSAPSIDLSNLGQAAFLKEIQDERYRELCFENLRKNDLIRWGIFYNRMKAVLANIPSGTSSYINYAKNTYSGASKRDVIWPIPTYEIGVNKYLKQNTGW